jgi:hypothetical protein
VVGWERAGSGNSTAAARANALSGLGALLALFAEPGEEVDDYGDVEEEDDGFGDGGVVVEFEDF